MNARIVRHIFGDNPTKSFLISIVIHMYNMHVYRVDITDQRQSYWPTHFSFGT